MALENAWEKLYKAVRSMVGTGDIKDRIIRAFQANLLNITPENDLPGQLKNDFEKIMQELSPRESPGVLTSVEKMPDDKVAEIAKSIVDIYDSVTRKLAKSRM